MADPDTSLAALLVAASTASPLGVHHGGAAAPSTSDQLIRPLVLDYLSRHRIASPWLSHAWHSPSLIAGIHGAEPPSDIDQLYPRYLSSPLEDKQQLDPLMGFELLAKYRSDVASLARFSQRVDHATWYLYVALDGHAAGRAGGARRRPRAGVRVHRFRSWYGQLANQCFARWRTTRDILIADWSLPEETTSLYRTAFWSLCELTPADSHLKLLFEQDRNRACHELIRHVDAVAEQLALASELAETLSPDSAAIDDEARRDAIQQALLEKAGDRLSLTQAAERLGISRQALHKKIQRGAALGLMIDETLIVPSAQFVDHADKVAVVPGLAEAIAPFVEAEAGLWSALQYLIEPDPALAGAAPLDVLKKRDVARVIAGARAYLGLDEG